MTDAALGFLLLGIALLVVLGIVFVLASRGGPRGEPPEPPAGVHMPGPSYLPVVFSVAMVLIGAGLAFRLEDWPVNPWIFAPGVLLLVAGIVFWVRAANREWHEVEHGSHHDDGAAH
ncbi:MAG TPA: hypothetical protein VLA76_10020 [Candidatus Angelobacter sp.]|nr:hypothetical protein [Candidatus Angelobacter sp.]